MNSFLKTKVVVVGTELKLWATSQAVLPVPVSLSIGHRSLDSWQLVRPRVTLSQSHTVSPTGQPDDASAVWSVGLAALSNPARARSRFVKVQELLPTATTSRTSRFCGPPLHHRTFSTSTAPTRCRDWPPQIRSFSLALALPARHSRREYLSARAARQ